jgi:hypothetical protein
VGCMGRISHTKLIIRMMFSGITTAPYQMLVMALVVLNNLVSSNYALPEVTVCLLIYTYFRKYIYISIIFRKRHIHKQLSMKWSNRKTNVKKKATLLDNFVI